MSTDACHSPSPSPLGRPDVHDPLVVFVTHAHAVATGADPMLANLLASILGGDHARHGRARWNGDRREGLELCQRLLLYVRHEVADRRIDVSLRYIAGELESMGAEPSVRAAH